MLILREAIVALGSVEVRTLIQPVCVVIRGGRVSKRDFVDVDMALAPGGEVNDLNHSTLVLKGTNILALLCKLFTIGSCCSVHNTTIDLEVNGSLVDIVPSSDEEVYVVV